MCAADGYAGAKGRFLSRSQTRHSRMFGEIPGEQPSSFDGRPEDVGWNAQNPIPLGLALARRGWRSPPILDVGADYTTVGPGTDPISLAAGGDDGRTT